MAAASAYGIREEPRQVLLPVEGAFTRGLIDSRYEGTRVTGHVPLANAVKPHANLCMNRPQLILQHLEALL